MSFTFIFQLLLCLDKRGKKNLKGTKPRTREFKCTVLKLKYEHLKLR